MSATPAEAPARDGDRLIGFTLPGRGARGRLVRLDSTAQAILAAHAYPEPIARLLAEALALTALLGALLRPEEGQLTVQARGTGGPVKLLVTDYRDGELRGYAAQDLDRRFPPAETLAGLFGRGQLVITLDQTASAERYQGIVELGGETLEAAATHYFRNSEQLPTLVRLAAGPDSAGRWTAGGLLVQHLPRAEAGGARLHVDDGMHPDWHHVEALAATVSDAELTDAGLALDDLIWRLFHEDEPRVLPSQALGRGCRCSTDHIARVLGQFPEAERATMRNADGLISVDCEFCARQFLLRM
ncbi:MAG: Hsp33 family molecular chaperone HslO [Sphingomonadaceae bacterium]